MYARYGTKTINRGCCGVSVDQSPVVTSRGEIWAHDVTLDLEIMLTSQRTTLSQMTADIRSQTEAVAIAFRKNFLDFRYLHADGSPSHIILLNRQCLGGVRILKPCSWPDSKGVEHVTKRTVRVTLGGRVPLPLAELSGTLHEFKEECQFSPAGALTGHLETLVTLPVKQLLRRHQVYRATQSGSAIGLFDYPNIQDITRPIWPQALVNQEPLLTKGAPQTIGDDHCLFPVAWTWLYESSTRLSNGRPRIWRRDV